MIDYFTFLGSEEGCNQDSQPLNDATNGATSPSLIFVFFYFLVVLSSF